MNDSKATFASVQERRHDYLLQVEQRAKRAMEVGKAHDADFYSGIQSAADYILHGADDYNEFGDQP